MPHLPETNQFHPVHPVVLRWSRHPRCVGLARLELRKALGRWGLSDLEDSAALVLSELLTNAARHARVSPAGRSRRTTSRARTGCGSRYTMPRRTHPSSVPRTRKPPTDVGSSSSPPSRTPGA